MRALPDVAHPRPSLAATLANRSARPLSRAVRRSGTLPGFKQDMRFTRSADRRALGVRGEGEGLPLLRAPLADELDLDWRTPDLGSWLDAFGARYRFHRYDSRGCGLSDREATDANLDALVAYLEGGGGSTPPSSIELHCSGISGFAVSDGLCSSPP